MKFEMQSESHFHPGKDFATEWSTQREFDTKEVAGRDVETERASIKSQLKEEVTLSLHANCFFARPGK